MVASIPQEIADIIVDEVAEEPDPVLRLNTLRACSLVSHTWVYRSQEHLFSKMKFNETGFRRWCSSIRPGTGDPSHPVTHLYFTQEPGDSLPVDLALAASRISSFPNLRVLHLTNIPLQSKQIRSTFGKFGPAVSRLLLERCQMDSNNLASFLHPFTNLEDLSLLDPCILSGPNTGYPPKPPSTKGKVNLELRIDVTHSGRSFVYGLSLLPVAIHTITLLEGDPPIHVLWNYGPDPRTMEINNLLAASRGTLTRFRVHGHLPWGIDLANVDTLQELEFNVDQIHNIAQVLQTITSSRLAVIVLNPSGNHHNYPNTWIRLDTALYALADRILVARGPQDDRSCLRVKLFLRSKIPDYDFKESAGQLPRCIARGCVTVFGAIAEDPCVDPEDSMYRKVPRV